MSVFTFGASSASSDAADPPNSPAVFRFAPSVDTSASPLSVALASAPPNFSFAATPTTAAEGTATPSKASTATTTPTFSFTTPVDLGLEESMSALSLASVASQATTGSAVADASFTFAVRPSDLTSADRDLLGSSLLRADDDPATLAFRARMAGKTSPTTRLRRLWVRGIFMGSIARLAPGWSDSHRAAVVEASATPAVRTAITAFVSKEAWAWASMRATRAATAATADAELARYLAVVERSAAASVALGGVDAARHAEAAKAARLAAKAQ